MRLSTLANRPRGALYHHALDASPTLHLEIRNITSRFKTSMLAGADEETTVSPDLTVSGAPVPLFVRLFFHGELHRNFSEISSRLEIDTIRELLTTPSLLPSDRPISPSGSQPEAKLETTTETQSEHHKTSTRAAAKTQKPFDAETESRPFTLIG
ncbi:hypothetical protein Bca4012_010588 [Brassica carinata]|uniref:Uncharacterized protein n=1 Tax=Brassica carinata TaxID=52824 RepID=A0A8X7V0L8_BRACI|nr:hypothetical protein Bca52824_035497 [Brassica carinata]